MPPATNTQKTVYRAATALSRAACILAYRVGTYTRTTTDDNYRAAAVLTLSACILAHRDAATRTRTDNNGATPPESCLNLVPIGDEWYIDAGPAEWPTGEPAPGSELWGGDETGEHRHDYE